MKKNIFILCMIGIMCSTFFSACVAVKEYEKMYINDADMSLNPLTPKKFETTFQVYREGAAGANGGKAGGGCGCN